MRIDVKRLSDGEWLVTVDAPPKTEHRVKISDSDLARFANGRSPEELLKTSFEFLLERESNTSILSSFDLPVISLYFPDYEREMRKRLGR
jgi:hypothetical protein